MSSTHPAAPLSSPLRDLLRRYALAWAKDALRGVRRLEGEEALAPEVVLADPFAGEDYPAAASSAPGIAAAARLLGGGEAGGVRVLLAEEDPVKVEWIAEGVRAAGLQPSLAGGWSDSEPLVVHEGEWTARPDLAPLVREAREALLLLDPPMCGKLPWEALRPLLRAPGVEVLLRFPTAELRRLARYPGSTLADLPLYGKRAVEGISRLLGDARHEWFFDWRVGTDAGNGARADGEVVARYLARLRSESAGAVHRWTIPVSNAEAADLILVTSRASRALRLNELLYESRSAGELPWPVADAGPVRYVETGELQLFAGQGPGEVRERRVDRTLLAHSIAQRFAGRSVSYGEVLGAMVPDAVFEDEVRRALTELRRDGRALFRSLPGEDAGIAFPSARLRTGARPGRRRGATSPAELGLSLEQETE